MTETFRFEPAARVHRAGGLDAVHCAVIAVVNAESRLTHSLGEVTQSFFTRSAIKPFQALPLVSTGALDRLKWGAQELAIACASHNGSDQHRALVAAMLKRLELDERALQCGAHVPLGLQVKGEPPKQNVEKDPLRHNCSGKHAGFLALTRLSERKVAEYLDPEGSEQQAVRRAVLRSAELSEEAVMLGTDGCSAPNFAFPVRNLAIAFKNLALAELGRDRHQDALARVRGAMQEHPILVSGERRLDYDLARAFPGNVVNKSGAEGVLALGFRQPALGIAIKVVDGASRALGPIAIETLAQLGIVDRAALPPTLERHARPTIQSYQKRVVGEIRAEFRLTPATP